MTIEFLEGTINSKQHEVPEAYRTNMIEALSDGEWCFMDSDSLWMDKDGLLWIDANTPMRTPDEDEIDEYLLLLKIPEGFVVDISHALDEFRYPDTADQVRFLVQEQPPYAADGFATDPTPVIGLISNDLERELFVGILKSTYPDYEYPNVTAFLQ